MIDEELVKRLRSASKHPMMDNSCKADVFDVSEAADRIEALTAELAKAVEALREIAGECGCSTARATLAEIKGDSHE
jgi:hypothetical protein